MRNVSAIVLAAGLSSRMQGPNKLLMPWGETTVVGSVVDALVASGLDVRAVTGRDVEKVAQAVSPALCIFNIHFKEGLGRSISCGVAFSPETHGYLIALGDMPGLQASTVSALIKASRDAADDAIIAPAYSGEPDRTGHPVLFGPAHRAALTSLEGDTGARSIIQANEPRLIRVSVGGKLLDVDVPEDLLRIEL